MIGAAPGRTRPWIAAELRRGALLAALGCALLGAALLALCTGALSISLSDLASAGPQASLHRDVLMQIRAPRVLLAGVVGAMLGLAGAALQGLFRNPLADPGLIGVSSGAALGAVAVIVLGSGRWLGFLAGWLLPLAAFAGAGAVTLFLYRFAQREGQLDVPTLLLAGVAMNALATTGIGFFIYLSDDEQLRSLSFWMLGSFGGAAWSSALPVAALIAIAAAVLLGQSRALDRLQLGEGEARRVGVPVQRVKRNLVLAVAAGVGAGVALSGSIGFVGLVVPHLVRLCGGALHGFVLPGSLLLGATLMVGADLLARTLVIPAELPVGLLTSALGAPFFLWLLARRRAA